MKEQLLIFGLILGLIITFISTILGQIYLNTIIWISIGVGVMIISFWLFRYSSDSEDRKLKQEENKKLKKLIKDGIKITVDLSKCEIKSSNMPIGKTDLDYLNETEVINILLDSEENQKQNTIDYSVLIYNHKLDSGQIIKFYGPTTKDKKTLEILCAIQKRTLIYFDRNDIEIYYFDLGFVE